MTRQGLRSRVLFGACTYVLVAFSIVGGAFLTAMALTSSEGASAASPNVLAEKKIGPGYARMQPVYLGKPEKLVYSTPYYYPHTATPAESWKNRPAPSVVTAIATTTSTVVAEVVQPGYVRPDIHRVY